VLRDEPTLRPGLHRMPERPIGPRVLIPAFRQATAVRGAFGWFSAGWIGRLAPGLAEYLQRSEVGPIEFTVAPQLFQHEAAAVTAGSLMSSEEAAERIKSVFVEGTVSADALARHALDCLSWMIATGRLVLRIAVPHPWSNYHPKIWLFEDGRDRVVVRGSGNATDKGVHSGVEHMDVDVSWEQYSEDRVREASSMLDDWERGRSRGILSVHDLPDAVERQIIQVAPESPPTPSHYLRACVREGRPIYAVTPDMIPTETSRRPAPKRSLQIPDWLNWTEPPYDHQSEAVAAWEGTAEDMGARNTGERGILAMATGSGKTITSLLCAARKQDRVREYSFLIVISAPSTPLLRQWESEVKDFGVTPTVPTLHSKGTEFALTQFFRRLGQGGTHIAIVTNNLLCSKSFQRSVHAAVNETGAHAMLVADEAHTLGANQFISSKPEFFATRLALSATPERQYDPDGTEQLLSFFGPTVYEFGLAKAIGFCLVPYDYHLHATTLSGEELDQFANLSERIGQKISQGVDLDDDTLTSLLIARRRIVETASAKLALVREVLSRRGPDTLSHALIYASSKNPEQFSSIKGILDDLGVVYAQITENETSNDTLMQSLFSGFARGDFQVLLAKKVLDEGVDIPSIKEAFLVASSTVEREWIQRRGRILRRAAGKTKAILHDFLALPPVEALKIRDDRSLKRAVANELGRSATFARHASNAAGEDGVLSQIAKIRKSYWRDSGGNTAVLMRQADSLIAPDMPIGALL
jgi:superfamily II DNA or RNA helicase